MSEPAILGVGTRDQWRGVEVTDDGVPEILGVLLLRLLRRLGPRGVADTFISSPWGWRSLPLREKRDSGSAPWFTPGDAQSRTHFLTWFILDLEGQRLEVHDVNSAQWLEPVQLAPDGRALNRPAWLPEPSPWLPTRAGVIDVRSARVLQELRQRGIAFEQARAIVAAWLRGLVPGSTSGDWQARCANEATVWSAWRLEQQRLWLPDRLEDSFFEFILSTEDGVVGLGSSAVADWWEAARRAGVGGDKKIARTLESLFSAAVAPGSKLPVQASVTAIMPREPSGPLEALRQKLLGPVSEPLPRPVFLELLPDLSRQEFLRRLETGEMPDNLVEGKEGFHPAREFQPSREWIAQLVQAVSFPLASGTPDFPKRRRMFFWPYEEA